MDQDPNQPHSGQYGQQGEQSSYQSGYQPQGEYQQPGAGTQQQHEQRQYGKSGRQQVHNIGNPLGPTSMNLTPNISAALSYVGWWITGLIFFVSERRNRFVRFHAIQSILVFVGLSLLWTVLKFIFSIPIIGAVSCFLGPLVGFATFLIWAGLIVLALLGKEVKIPIVGDFAKRFAGHDRPL